MSVLPAIIGACGVIGAVVVSHLFTRTKLREIHVLVNARLDKALEDLDDLRAELRTERRKHK